MKRVSIILKYLYVQLSACVLLDNSKIALNFLSTACPYCNFCCYLFFHFLNVKTIYWISIYIKPFVFNIYINLHL